MALTKPTQDALAILTREEERHKVNITDITTDMKNSDFFRQNWDSLLIATPNCLEILGDINLVATTPWAQATPLNGDFKYLKDARYLSGALTCISSQANRSFDIASKNMTRIQMNTGSVIDQFKFIYRALATPSAPMAVITSRLEVLKETAVQSYNQAKEIQDNMDLWAELVHELHEACDNSSSSIEEKRGRSERQLKLAKDAEKARIELEIAAKGEITKMGDALNDAKEAYKKALDDMPTGMEFVGGTILMGLSESVGTVLSTYGAASKPVGAVGSSSKGLASLVNELKGDASTNRNAKDDFEGANGTSTSVSEDNAQKQAAEKKKELLTIKIATAFIRHAKPKTEDGEDSSVANSNGHTSSTSSSGGSSGYVEYDLSGEFMTDDPALVIAPSVAASIEALKDIVVGLPTGINWDSAIAQDPSDPTELATVNYALGRILKDFRPRKGALASQLLVATVTEAISVADELEAECKKSAQISTWEKPTRESDICKDWDERISRCYQNAIALHGASQSIPGGVGTRGVSLSMPQQTPEEKIANMNYKQAIAEQTVKSATTKLTSTQQAYIATLDTYRKSTETVQEIKDALAKARADVTSLDASKLSLEEIKEVLIGCIGYLIEFKDRVSRLVVSFSTLTAMIDLCLTKQVLPFKQDLEVYSQANTAKAELYEKYCRDIIFRMVLQILSNFLLYKDITAMYLDVDRKVIRHMVDWLADINVFPELDNDDFLEQRQTLLDSITEAEGTVHSIVKAKQDETIKSLESRIVNIGETLEQFPVELRPDEKVVQSAKDGAALAMMTAEAAAAQPSGLELASKFRQRQIEG